MKRIITTINKFDKEHVFSDAVNCMISALEYRDPYTKGHSQRVGFLAAHCSTILYQNEDISYVMKLAGQLHDIGKIGVPDSVLLKKGRLTDMEWREMRRHPSISADIVSEGRYLSEIAEMIKQHHERWDGKGYPDGIKREEISAGGRILALCDALDAMASNRPYRDSLTWSFIERELFDNLGTQFDPSLEEVIPKLIVFWRENYESDTDRKIEAPILIDNLKNQHSKIYELINEIRDMVDQNDFENNSENISISINQLAGLLRIHLSSEDRYLYPKMINSGNKNIQELAEKFDKEMGGLSNNYITFKIKYNASYKIMEDTLTFKKEVDSIMDKLLERLIKEDAELYPLVDGWLI